MKMVYTSMREMSQEWSSHENSVHKCERNESRVE